MFIASLPANRWRYFCGNHTPGLWLDGPVCRGCAARFGEAAKGRAEPAPEPPSTVPIRKPRRPGSGPPVPGGVEPPRRDPPRPPAHPGLPLDSPSLADLLAHIAGDREPGRDEGVGLPSRVPAPEAPRRSVPVLGCLVRLILLVLFSSCSPSSQCFPCFAVELAPSAVAKGIDPTIRRRSGGKRAVSSHCDRRSETVTLNVPTSSGRWSTAHPVPSTARSNGDESISGGVT